MLKLLPATEVFENVEVHDPLHKGYSALWGQIRFPHLKMIAGSWLRLCEFDERDEMPPDGPPPPDSVPLKAFYNKLGSLNLEAILGSLVRSAKHVKAWILKFDVIHQDWYDLAVVMGWLLKKGDDSYVFTKGFVRLAMESVPVEA